MLVVAAAAIVEAVVAVVVSVKFMNIFFPIEFLADWVTFSLFKLSQETRLGEVVSYFIFDTIKVFLLLAVIIYIVSFVRTYLPPEKIRDILSHKNKYVGHVLAALFGIITPFCSCSAVPLFLGFVEAGVPLGVTFSFLVSSPMINEVALVLLFGMFGWKIALIYVLSGLLIAIFSGIVIGLLNVENLLADFINKNRVKHDAMDLVEMTNKERREYSWNYVKDIIKKVWPYIIVGIGLGAWIHGYVPTDFLAQYAGADKWYAVPVAVLIGIPLYSNAAGVVPLVSALTEKGVSMGTTLAFMMAVTALSLPEFMILKKVMKTRLILIFATTVGLGIIIIGYLFNYVLGSKTNLSGGNESLIKIEQPVKVAKQEIKNSQSMSSAGTVADKVQVFLFHSTQRCATCSAIGKLAGETVNERFQDEIKSGRIEFKEINIDLPENEELARKFGATGSTLRLNSINNGEDNITEDTRVWRLTSNTKAFKDYLEAKLNIMLGK